MAEEKKEEIKKEELKEETKEEKPKEEKPKEEKPKEEKPKEEKPKEEKPKEEKPKEEEEEEVEVPKKFADLVKKIEEMKVSDLAELVKILEKKFGVSSAPQVVAQAAGGGGSAEAGAEAEEKSSYNVELSSVGDKKIDVIKVVRDVTQKGLKEAKGLVDSVENEPQIIKENAKKEEAEEIKKKFEEAGAKIELK